MEELKLLIVEDDPNVVDTYERGIKAYNLESKVKVVAEVSKDRDSAISRLNDNHSIYDAAIVDLDLMGTTGDDKSGNEVIRLIKERLRFPVFVISGTPHNLDEDLREESSLFKVKARGDEGDYLEEIVSIYRTGITKILNRTGTIENYITEIFWKHLSNSLDLWINDNERSDEEKQKSLLRYTLLHIQEYLELTADSDFENYHPAEIYITPPIKDKVFTGDILLHLESNERFIVLTPSCDLAHEGKTDYILLSKIDSGIFIPELKSIINNIEESKGNIKNARKDLERIITNNKSSKYHFLPEYKTLAAGLIDFQYLNKKRI
jgi:CheY-like chemotaxis protein